MTPDIRDAEVEALRRELKKEQEKSRALEDLLLRKMKREVVVDLGAKHACL